jgi:ribonuclease P protein subunit POP4
MPLTPETLVRHELCGLHVEVADAPNPDLVGIAGRVVSETTKTLVVRVAPEAQREGGEAAGDSGEKQVPKRGTAFVFALTDEAAPAAEVGGTASKLRSETAGDAAGQSGRVSERRSEARRTPSESDGGEGVAYVTVDGARLLSRPARRTENGGAPTWR